MSGVRFRPRQSTTLLKYQAGYSSQYLGGGEALNCYLLDSDRNLVQR